MIVLLLGPYPPPHGGVQTNLVAIRDHLRQVYGPDAAPVINLTRHRSAAADAVYHPRSALGVAKLLLTIPADIIHLHIGGKLSARLLALCLFCSLVPNRRTVLTFHSGGYPSWQKKPPRRFSLRGFILRRLDTVIAVNAEIAGLFRALGVPNSRCRTMCPYVPVAARADVQLPETLSEFARAHTPLLTTVSGLEPEYDLPLQIRALDAVRRTFPRAGLAIVGSGSQHAALRGLIAEQSYRDHILLCGDLPHAVTMQWLARSDVFLRTTLYDGDSISVREALQLGVPVIATDNGMRPDGVTLIPTSDAAALTAAIVTEVNRRPASRAAPPVDGSAAGRTAGAAVAPLAELLDVYDDLLAKSGSARHPGPLRRLL